MKALLLAAGLGTRLKPFTDKHPKALAPVNGKSLLEWNIRNLQQHGIYDIVVNVHHFADQIERVLLDNHGFGSRYRISDEREAVLETGGGLMHAAPLLKDQNHFLVLNVDILSHTHIGQLIHHHEQQGALATLAVQQRHSSRYFLFNSAQQLCGWQHAQTGEKRIPVTGSDRAGLRPLAFSGMQVLRKDIFDKVTLRGKFSLVDAYLSLCAHERIIAWDHTGDLLLDVGKPESLKKAAELFG